MKLYMHPASTACRPVALFCAEEGIEVEQVVVDLFTGAQFQEPYSKLNPNCIVPALEDDGFLLTESSAILKYLADGKGSAAYPKELKARARVNELCDWFNTNFYRAFGYELVYPQTLPHRKLGDDAAATQALVALGKAQSERWLGVLDRHWLGDGRPFVCGEAISLADYLGSGIVTVGDWIGQEYGAYPNVDAWLGRMRALPSWAAVHEAHAGAVDMFSAGRPYVTAGA